MLNHSSAQIHGLRLHEDRQQKSKQTLFHVIMMHSTFPFKETTFSVTEDLIFKQSALRKLYYIS